MLYFDSLTHVTADGTWFHTAHHAGADRLLRCLAAAAPARACLVGIAGHNMPNDLVAGLCREHADLLVPIAGVAPDCFGSSDDAAQGMARLAADGFRGVKLHPRLNGFDLADARVDRVMQAAGDEGMAVFVCTFLRGRGRTPSAPPVDLAARLLDRHPGTRCVLLHGGATDLLAFSDVVRSSPNALLDLSMTLLRYRHSSIDLDLRFVLERLDEKCVVGSDFPEHEPAEARRRTLELMEGLPPHKVENVLYGNLCKCLKVEP